MNEGVNVSIGSSSLFEARHTSTQVIKKIIMHLFTVSSLALSTQPGI